MIAYDSNEGSLHTGIVWFFWYAADSAHALGWLVSIDYSDATPDVAFTYDRQGRPLTVTDVLGTRTNVYDALNLLEERFPDGDALVRTYDAYGRVNGIALGPDYAIGYGYDEFGRFSTVAVSNGPTFGYSYVSCSPLLSGYTNDLGLAVAYEYEPHRDVKTLVSNAWGTNTISTFAYTYDALGRRTARIDDSSTTNLFGYNLRSELVSAEMGTNSYSYAYDPIGNRTETVENGFTTTYAANSLNQYTVLNPSSPNPTPFTYDPDGNMTSDGHFVYTWNAENRMVMASNSEVVVTYAYDHQGRMSYKEISRVDSDRKIISYLWDNWNIIRENQTTTNNSCVTYNVWGLDLDGTLQGTGGVGALLAVVRNDAFYTPTYDANGNITEYIATSSGTIAAHRDYSSFGEPIVSAGDCDAFTHWFSTKPWCPNTGLVEYQYRKYGPKIGRWMSRDPIGEKGCPNINGFISNRPTTSIDFIGLIVIYIGGAMEGPMGHLLDFKKRIGADVAFEWNQQTEAIARIKKEAKAHPCDPIILIGHSWGGDSAMDVAAALEDDPCLKCFYVVTLDPVSHFDPDIWLGGPHPGEQITEWIHIAQPAGVMDHIVRIPVVGWLIGGVLAGGSALATFNDGIATGGGQWNSEPQATYDIPAVNSNGKLVDHMNIDGMLDLKIPGTSQTVKQHINELKGRRCCP